jgi:hypothetical protein
VQVFNSPGQEQIPVLGVVGQLQFEVLQHRLENEYSVEVILEPLPYQHARWVRGEGASIDNLEDKGYGACVLDQDKRLVILFKSDWALSVAQRDYPQALEPRLAKSGPSVLFLSSFCDGVSLAISMNTLPLQNVTLDSSKGSAARSRRASSAQATEVPMSCATRCARVTPSCDHTSSRTSACASSEYENASGLSERP